MGYTGANLNPKIASKIANSNRIGVSPSKGRMSQDRMIKILGGDIQAIKELFDRTYGKSKQNIELGNADESGLKINIIKKNDNN